LELNAGDAPRTVTLRRMKRVTKTEIRQLLQVCDYEERAILLFLKDCGLGRTEAVNTQLLHFEPDQDWTDWHELFLPENAPLHFREVRKKTRIPFMTFLGPESIQAVRVYLEQREQGTQHLENRPRKKGMPPEPLTKQSFLFRNKTNFNKKSPSGLTVEVQRVARRVNLEGVSPHSFRRFFQTTMENPDIAVPAPWIKVMMAHKLNPMEWAYSQPTVDELREAYRPGMRYLQIEASMTDYEQLSDLRSRLDAAEEARETDRKEIDLLRRTLRRLLDSLDRERELGGD